MSKPGQKISSFLWWTYPRGSIEYDVMVALILAFIFLTPRGTFHDQPRAAASGVVLAAAPPAPQQTLAQVLAALDRSGPDLRTLGAKAQVTDFTALVNDASKSSGMLYFERDGAKPRYALDLTRPKDAAKRLLYRDDTAWVYTPASKQVMKYTLGNRQNLVDQFLLVGMGATGQDLQRSFELKLAGDETIAGKPTVHLVLTPRDPATRDKVPHLDLWYDTATAVALQQQVWQPGGDYHLVQLSDVKVNTKLPGNAFSTDFHGAQVVQPGG